MTIRDLQTASVGAFLSFAITLGTVEKSPVFVRWGLFISLAIFVTTLVFDQFQRPWISIDAIPLKRIQSGDTLIQLGITNRGRKAMDEKIINVLVPDDLAMATCYPDGRSRPTVLLHTPETVDGVHGSDFWHDSLTLTPGTRLLHFTADLPEVGSFVRVNIEEKRRDIFVSNTLGDRNETTFAPVRAGIWAACSWVSSRARRPH